MEIVHSDGEATNDHENLSSSLESEMMKIIKKSQRKREEKPSQLLSDINETLRWYQESKLESDPMSFWKEQSCSANEIKKKLSEIAKYYLTPPPTSVDVERLFSTAGDIVTKERNRLNPKNAEKILFCRENLPILNYQY